MDQQQLDLPGILHDTVLGELETGDGLDAEVLNRGELHLHMNGAIPTETIRKIVAEESTLLPTGFEIDRDLVRTTPCQSLAESVA